MVSSIGTGKTFISLYLTLGISIRPKNKISKCNNYSFSWPSSTRDIGFLFLIDEEDKSDIIKYDTTIYTIYVE